MIFGTHLRSDFLSGIVVFLVAVPLCLGIALACGVPLYSGIISGVLGGVVVGLLSESRVSVSGPAAGMVTVVVAGIAELGSFELFLLALVFAGIIQVGFGLFRAGFISNFIPSTVIKGLLAAIGILIIIKQLPLAFGYFIELRSFESALQNSQETVNVSTLENMLSHLSVGASIISCVSLLILCFWEKIPFSFLRKIPSSFIVVLVGVLINYLYDQFAPNYVLEASDLVNIPIITNTTEFWEQFRYPDFSNILNMQVYLHAITIAIVASLETLLNFEAVEKLDQRRHSSRDRELVAQGIGNICSGLVGGLPITSVIVRSSVNINAGAKTKLSAILHGVFLFLSLTLFAVWLNCIPISALAAILIYTGYKLARISLFAEVYREGPRYFIPFIVTVVAIVSTNLLLGILIGLGVSVFFILRHNSKNGFSMVMEKHPVGEILRLVLPQQVTFLNRAAIVDGLHSIPINSKIIIDATFTDYIDQDILEVILNARDSFMLDKNILCNLEGFKKCYELKDTNSFLNVTTCDVQASLTPRTILTILQEGNNRFINNTPIHKNYKQQVAATSKSQHPMAVVLSCIDSRVPVELIFDLGLGDVFVVRVAGNILNSDVIASIEYSCHVVGAKLIVVLGHKECGAVKAACDDFKLGHITQLVDKIKPAIEVEMHNQTDRCSDHFFDHVACRNVRMVEEALYQNSAVLRELIDQGFVGLTSGFYNINTGRVQWLQKDTNSIVPENGCHQDPIPPQNEIDTHQ